MNVFNVILAMSYSKIRGFGVQMEKIILRGRCKSNILLFFLIDIQCFVSKMHFSQIFS